MQPQPRPPQSIDTIVHLGAGACSELDTWLATNPRRVVLVEANPAMVRRLNTAARRDERIEIVSQAVAAAAGPKKFRVFNMAALSSLREPTGVLELFPGLRTERELDVDAVAPVDLFESFELDPDGQHWLIIDAPGEEAAIVDSLCMAEQLDRFGRIILHCGIRALYKGNSPVDALLDQIEKAGYDLEQRDDSDPDRPCWSLRRNPLRLENQALRRQISGLEGQTRELSQARDEQAKRAKEREQALEALERDKKGLEKKVAELEEQTGELGQARDEQAKRAKEREQALEALEQDKKGLEKKVAELEKQRKELAQSRDEQAERAAEREQQETALKQETESLKDRIAELEAENKELEESREAARQAEQEAGEKLNVEIRQRKEEAEARVKAEELEQERSRQLAERQQQLQRLQADEAEIEAREGQLDEEITRAEAQIDLIKDLLLREERQ